MRFDHVGVVVSDLPAARAFARDVLRLGDPVREAEIPDHGLDVAFFALGEGRLELFTLDGAPGRLAAGETAAIDHVAVIVDDLDAEQARLAAQGVRFTGPQHADHVDDATELRGARHLWTDPATSGGFRLQLTEEPR